MSTSAFAIIGGKDANIEEFPWHVSIQVKDSQEPHNCGGSIIAPNIILTAEHCMVFATTHADGRPMPQNKDRYFVKTGITDWRQSSAQTAEIKKVVFHNVYEKFSGYDVSLLVLDQCLTYNDKVQPIEIGDEAHENITAIGWGMSAYPNTYPYVLQKAELKVHSQDEATKRIAETSVLKYIFKFFGSFESPMSTLIAAGGTGTDTGTKDSGGSVTAADPLIQKPMLLGITSWGNEKTGGYVRASYFKNWIDQKVQKHSKKCR